MLGQLAGTLSSVCRHNARHTGQESARQCPFKANVSFPRSCAFYKDIARILPRSVSLGSIILQSNLYPRGHFADCNWITGNPSLTDKGRVADCSDVEQHKHVYRRQFIKDKIFQCDLVRAAGEALRRAALSQIDHHRWVIN